MAFGVATVLTDIGKALIADRIRTTPATYTSAPTWIGIGVGATGAARTAVAADTALTTPVESRINATISITGEVVSGDTYKAVATFEATAARAVDELGLFDASSGGNMAVSATFNPIDMVTQDTIEMTVRLRIA